MKVTLLGGTKGIGRALGRLFVERGDALFLLGRDLRELKRSACDLKIRAGTEAHVGTAHCDLQNPEGFSNALDTAEAFLQGLDVVVVTAGILNSQASLEQNPELVRQLLEVNFVNTVVFCEHARKRLLARGGGTLCVVSSVAGDRGRKPVIVYGAGKAGLSCYLEGLDHKFRAAGLRTVCIKAGFIKTGMTSGLKPPPFAAEPESAARSILQAIDRGKPIVYVPWIWWAMMGVVRALPHSLMRRLSF